MLWRYKGSVQNSGDINVYVVPWCYKGSVQNGGGIRVYIVKWRSERSAENRSGICLYVSVVVQPSIETVPTQTSIWTQHCSNLRSSLLRCSTRPNEWGTQWDWTQHCNISSKVNVIAWLEFELAYYDVAVQLVIIPPELSSLKETWLQQKNCQWKQWKNRKTDSRNQSTMKCGDKRWLLPVIRV